MISLDHVSYKYPDGNLALDDISLHLAAGRCYCLSGPNGCGKSTLFRILNGLSFATSGKYLLEGEEITEKRLRDKAFSASFHRRIGFILQNTEVQLFTRSVEDEIAFGLYQMGLPDEEVTARVEKYISLLGLESLRHRAPFNLSGGEKKRTALAAVLAMEPPVLIMDEPLSGLDEDGQIWVTDFINRLKTPDRLLLIATHNKDLISTIADETIYMTKDHTLL